MADAAPTTAAKCGCTYEHMPWHDQVLTLEDDLWIITRLVDQCQDQDRDFIDPEELLLFVSEHEWRDRRAVTRFASYLASVDGLIGNLTLKLDAAEAAEVVA
jgi:hypothetical protein